MKYPMCYQSWKVKEGKKEKEKRRKLLVVNKNLFYQKYL